MDTENKTSGETVENNDAQTPEENTSEAQEAKEEEVKDESKASDTNEPAEDSREEPEADDDDDEEEDESASSAELLKDLRRKNRENKNLRERMKVAEAKALKYEVAAEANVPLSWAERLKGETKKELLKDASELLETFGQKVPTRLNKQPNDGATRAETEKPFDPHEVVRRTRTNKI